MTLSFCKDLRWSQQLCDISIEERKKSKLTFLQTHSFYLNDVFAPISPMTSIASGVIVTPSVSALRETTYINKKIGLNDFKKL